MEQEKLANLLAEHPELQSVSATRVRCTLTGHEMPMNHDTVLHFIQGTKFQRAKQLQAQLQKHEQYFEDRGSYLFCKLTRRRLTKQGAVIEKHINGRRFQFLSAKAAEADENGNQMETGSLSDPDDPAEPRLIDASDADSDDDILVNGNFGDDDSTSSVSSLQDLEASENCDLYPELAFSDSGGGGDSDYDFNAMDTDLDAEKATKRKVEGHSSETPAHKRRRC